MKVVKIFMSEKTYHMFLSFNKFDGMLAVMSLRNAGNMKVYRSAGPHEETDKNRAGGFEDNKDFAKQIEHEVYRRDEIVDKKAVANRGWFLSGLGIEHNRIVSVKSVHGDNIEIVSKSDGGRFIENTDGLITAASPGLFLSITVADCLPVIIFEPNQKIMCLLHCGWKGLVKGIICKAVTKIKDNFSGGEDRILYSLYAGIGPGIGACHFEIKKDILPFFSDYPDAVLRINAGDIPDLNNKVMNKAAKISKTAKTGITGKERYFVDLKLIAKIQLQKCGVRPENIETNNDCTYCRSDIFFSFRKDSKKPVDAMMVIAGWKS